MIPCVDAPAVVIPMNHLAHALLAAPDRDLMLGGLIADFVRGAPAPTLAPRVRAGIVLHRAIDSYTDAHHAVAAARRLFEPPLRRYAGIVLDVWFDHLLAQRWREFGVGTLDGFSAQVQALLDERGAELPTGMSALARYLVANDLPAAYAQRDVLERVYAGLARRLHHANPLADALAAITPRAAAIEAQFNLFMPELVAWCAAARAALDASN